MATVFVRDTDLAERFNVSRITIWRWQREKPDFPRCVKLSPRCSRWRLSDIEAWEAAQAGEVA